MRNYTTNRAGSTWEFAAPCHLHPSHFPSHSFPHQLLLLQLYHNYTPNTATTQHFRLVMGNRASTAHTRELEALQRSADIDRIIEEDSRQSMREHKVLFLGKGWPLSLAHPARDVDANLDQCRFERIWKVDRSQANKIPPPGRFLT